MVQATSPSYVPWLWKLVCPDLGCVHIDTSMGASPGCDLSTSRTHTSGVFTITRTSPLTCKSVDIFVISAKHSFISLKETGLSYQFIELYALIMHYWCNITC